MSSARVSDLIQQVAGAMRPSAPGADPAMQARMAIVLRHLLEAVEEAKLTEVELTGVCAFLDRIAEAKEWRFLTHVFGLDTLVAETTHGGEERRTVDNVEGPLYVAGAPNVASPALMMRPDEPGERLFLSGRVVNTAGQPLPHALLDIWQSNAAGRLRRGRPRPARMELPSPGNGRCVRPLRDRDGGAGLLRDRRCVRAGVRRSVAELGPAPHAARAYPPEAVGASRATDGRRCSISAAIPGLMMIPSSACATT